VTQEGAGADLVVTPISPADREWLADAVSRTLGSALQVSRGRLLRLDEHEGFIARRGGERLGFITYLIEDGECEVSGLASTEQGLGAGSALIEAVKAAAARAGCERLCLVTTNDNTHALRFYQRRGFRIAAVRVGRIEEYRWALKPEISRIGNDGIPIRDEIELEIEVTRARGDV
jgi:ribosomal protein S18 acetylase RimI-like enzyme